MKKKIVSLMLALTMAAGLTACGGSGSNTAPASTGDGQSTTESGTDTADSAQSTDAAEAGDAAEATGELVDGKFPETKHITVEVYDRGNDGGTDPTNNMYTEYIKKGMLEDHNVEVEFVSVPRWTETDEINNLLAAGTAPDICLTYSYPTIQTYANMGGVTDLKPLCFDLNAREKYETYFQAFFSEEGDWTQFVSLRDKRAGSTSYQRTTAQMVQTVTVTVQRAELKKRLQADGIIPKEGRY